MSSIQFAKSLSAYIEVTGPDPKTVKAASSDFYRASNGLTTVSASGTLVPWQGLHTNGPLVLCPGPLLFPFLIADARRADLSSVRDSALLPSTRIRVGLAAAAGGDLTGATLLGLFEVQPAARALAGLAPAGGSWRQGWGLSSETPAASRWLSPAASFLAVLQLPSGFSIPASLRADPCINQSPCPGESGAPAPSASLSSEPAPQGPAGPSPHAPLPQGTALVAVGSPFGALSPSHFAGTVFLGSVANVVLQGAEEAVVMVDMRCSPGMEGCPLVTNEAAPRLVGMLTAPLCNPLFNAEVPLAFSAACVAACFASWHTRWVSAGPSRTAAVQPHVQAPPPSRPSAPHPGQKPRQKPWERADARQGPSTAALASSLPAPQLAPSRASAPGPAAPCPRPAPLPARQSMVGAAARARASVVAVMTWSGAWATGVVMSRDGLILTNAHLTHPRGNKRGGGGSASSAGGPRDLPGVRVLLAPDGADGGGGRREWARGRVLYVFQALDLAVVQVSDASTTPRLLPVRLQEEDAREGEVVGVLGYPLISPTQGLGPWLTCGNLVRVVREAGQPPSPPALLITSAAVHAGADNLTLEQEPQEVQSGFRGSSLQEHH